MKYPCLENTNTHEYSIPTSRDKLMTIKEQTDPPAGGS